MLLLQKQLLELIYKKKVVLKMLQISQENTFVEIHFLTKLQAWGL